jgi:CHAT domain-containing protein
VWWVPGGLLGLLPIHAAGYHREEPSPDAERRTVMDRVVSSYTPTIRALRHARERRTAQSASMRSLIVAMPTTPGAAPLSNVVAEAANLHSRLPHPELLMEGGAGEPTLASVLEHLTRCSIAHFACHGHSDPADPSLSRLLLHDRAEPLTVASLAPVSLDHAELAYLSACETALNSVTGLLDEAIHLTSAFQMAGFPHVIGTLWEVNDAIAVRISDAFYTGLDDESGALDIASAAAALHQAVRSERDTLFRTPSLWAAYMHAGA